jgi:hypothetical protein
VLTTLALTEKRDGLNQLRYNLRKLKDTTCGSGTGSRYTYRLTTKGVEGALLLLFFHKRMCGPLANRRFHNQPIAEHRSESRLELAYYRADAAI